MRTAIFSAKQFLKNDNIGPSFPAQRQQQQQKKRIDENQPKKIKNEIFFFFLLFSALCFFLGCALVIYAAMAFLSFSILSGRMRILEWYGQKSIGKAVLDCLQEYKVSGQEKLEWQVALRAVFRANLRPNCEVFTFGSVLIMTEVFKIFGPLFSTVPGMY
jgi:hypothetical protein